jgi:hypothetical protein
VRLAMGDPTLQCNLCHEDVAGQGWVTACSHFFCLRCGSTAMASSEGAGETARAPHERGVGGAYGFSPFPTAMGLGGDQSLPCPACTEGGCTVARIVALGAVGKHRPLAQAITRSLP